MGLPPELNNMVFNDLPRRDKINYLVAYYPDWPPLPPKFWDQYTTVEECEYILSLGHDKNKQATEVIMAQFCKLYIYVDEYFKERENDYNRRQFNRIKSVLSHLQKLKDIRFIKTYDEFKDHVEIPGEVVEWLPPETMDTIHVRQPSTLFLELSAQKLDRLKNLHCTVGSGEDLSNYFVPFEALVHVSWVPYQGAWPDGFHKLAGRGNLEGLGFRYQVTGADVKNYKDLWGRLKHVELLVGIDTAVPLLSQLNRELTHLNLGISSKKMEDGLFDKIVSFHKLEFLKLRVPNTAPVPKAEFMKLVHLKSLRNLDLDYRYGIDADEIAARRSEGAFKRCIIEDAEIEDLCHVLSHLSALQSWSIRADSRWNTNPKASKALMENCSHIPNLFSGSLKMVLDDEFYNRKDRWCNDPHRMTLPAEIVLCYPPQKSGAEG